jgi:hypothetical protein
MALSARIGADFADFDRALDGMAAKIKTSADLAKNSGRDFDRLVASFDGTKIQRDAALMVAAIEKLHGPTTLTATEQARVNATVQQAIDKYHALGQAVPADLQKLADATKHVVAETAKVPVAAVAAHSAMDKLTSMAGTLGFTLGAGAALMGIRTFIGEVFRLADDLVRVSERTGETIEGVQRLGFVASQSGNDLDEITAAIGQLQNKIGSGDTAAIGALNDLGLSLRSVEDAGPEEAVRMIGQAMQGIVDPTQRAALATDLFGKQGRAILPTLIADYEALAAAAGIMSADTVRSLDEIGDAWDRLKGLSKAAGGEFLVSVAAAFEDPVTFLDLWMRSSNVSMALAGTSMGVAFRDSLKRELAKPLPTVEFKEITMPGTQTRVWAMVTTELDKYIATLGTANRALKPIELSTQELGRITAKSTAEMKTSWETNMKAAAVAATKTEKDAQAASTKLTQDWLKALSDAYNDYLDQQYADRQAAIKEEARVYVETAKMLAAWSASIWEGLGDQMDAWVTDYVARLTAMNQAGARRPGGPTMEQDNYTITEGNTLANATSAWNTYGSTAVQALEQITQAAGVADDQIVEMGMSFITTFQRSGNASEAFVNMFITMIARMIKDLTAVQKAVDALAENFYESVGGLENLEAAAQRAGISLDDLYSADTTFEMQMAIARITQELHNQNVLLVANVDLYSTLHDLGHQLADAVAESIPDWTDVSHIIEQYGIDLTKAGRAIQQMAANAAALELINHWEEWAAAFGDMSALAEGMQDEVLEFVRNAIKYSLIIPENMRPIIDALNAAGLLLDAAGNPIDINTLVYGPELESAQDENTEAILALTEAIALFTRQLLDAMGYDPNAINGTGNTNVGWGWGPGGNLNLGPILGTPPDWYGTPAYWAAYNAYLARYNVPPPAFTPPPWDAPVGWPWTQGYAEGSGGLVDFGTGTPAMLHGLEAVVTAQQMRNLLTGTNRASTGANAADVAARGGGHVSITEGAVTLSFEVHAINADGIRDLVEQDILPKVIESVRGNSHQSRTDLRDALGVR